MLKQRLIGAAVLIALGVIFIPMLLTGDGNFLSGDSESNVPPKPMYELEAPRVLPLDKRTQSSEPVGEPASKATDASADKAIKPEDAVKSDATTESASSETAKTAEQSDKTQAATESVAVRKQGTEKPAVAKTEAKQVEETSQSADKTAKTSTANEKVTTAKPAESTASTAEKPATESTAKKPIVSGFVVQLGSFSVKKNALNLRDSLRKKGHASFVEEYRHNGKVSYRVRVGPEQTRELANALKQKLKAETKIDGFIVAFPG